MTEQQPSPSSGEVLSTSDLIRHLKHAQNNDEVVIALGALSRRLPVAFLDRLINENIAEEDNFSKEISRDEVGDIEDAIRERYGFSNGLLRAAFGELDAGNVENARTMRNAESDVIWGLAKYFGDKSLTDEEIGDIYHDVTELIGREPLIPDEEFVKLFKSGGIPPELSGDKEETPEILDKKSAYMLAYEAKLEELRKRHSKELFEAADTNSWDIPGRTSDEIKALEALGPEGYAQKQGVPTGSAEPVAAEKVEIPKVEVAKNMEVCSPNEIREGAEFAELIRSKEDDDVRYILLYGKNGVLFAEETDREGTKYTTAEVNEVTDYHDLDDLKDYIDDNIESFEENPENKKFSIRRNIPIYRALTVAESLEQDRIYDEETSSKRVNRQYKSTENTDLTREISVSRHRHKGRKKKPETEENSKGVFDSIEQSSNRGYDSIESARITWEDFLDAEVNYNEFKNKEGDPRRQTVYGPSVAERKRKYARWLDMAAENHRKSLQLAFAEIEGGDIARGKNQKEKELRDQLLNFNFDNLDADGKVAVLRQLDGLLQDKINKLGLKTTKEIQKIEEEKSNKLEEQKLLKGNRTKNQIIEHLKYSKAQNPSDNAIEASGIKMGSFIEVPKEIRDASGVLIGEGVATEVDRFLVAPDIDRAVLQFIEDGKVVYHFVRIRRPDKRGKGEYEIRYFELNKDGELDIKNSYYNQLNESEIDKAFLRAYNHFLGKQETGEIGELGFVDLDEDFIRRLAELNAPLVELNRQRQRSKRAKK